MGLYYGCEQCGLCTDCGALYFFPTHVAPLGAAIGTMPNFDSSILLLGQEHERFQSLLALCGIEGLLTDWLKAFPVV